MLASKYIFNLYTMQVLIIEPLQGLIGLHGAYLLPLAALSNGSPLQPSTAIIIAKLSSQLYIQYSRSFNFEWLNEIP